MEKCIICQSSIPLCELANHIDECKQETSRNNEEDMDEDIAMAIQQSLHQEMTTVQQQSIIDIQQDGTSLGVMTLVINEQSEDQEQNPTIEVEAVVAPEAVLSVQSHIWELEDTVEEGMENEGIVRSPDSGLRTVLEDLQKGLQSGSAPIHNSLHVCREFIMEGSFRAFRRTRFNPLHQLTVTFVDVEGESEGAVDDGGPSREFLRLLVAALRDSRYFEGPEDRKNLSLVSRGLQFGDYKIIGQMLSLALLQGGVQPSFFSTRLYSLLCGQQTGPVSLEEVGDWELRQHLEKIKAAENLEEAQQAVQEASPLLCPLGCAGFLPDMESQHTFVEQAARAHVEGRIKPALDQLVEGLDCLKVAEAMRNHPETLSPIFVSGHNQLTVQNMINLFDTDFSPPGSNA
ncbi:uncharacterized protein LOC106535614 [Austrofundulus limnaeus]|uniref:Uncharacterized protein LOC106535614 n=1 Tax=Austrofundulus limnaeus TaxID=52670 RepID=A0A2I4D7B2_AUSLI|nr:PREDICTED: uncharacterized protein LOC106535614 [Austrofundulus limnaeus]